jgi:hypothetical protein
MLTDAYLAAALLPALFLFLAHFFPWGALPGRHGEPLPRLVTYAIGTFAIVGWTSVLALRYAYTAWDVLVLLWIVAASAGGATVVAWSISKFLALSAEARIGEITEKALRDGRD